jgi:hypothetical protein
VGLLLLTGDTCDAERHHASHAKTPTALNNENDAVELTDNARVTPSVARFGNWVCSYEGRSVKTVGANDGGVTKTADQGNPETKSAALDSIFVLGSDSNAAAKTRHTARTARLRRLAGSFTTLTVRTSPTYARGGHNLFS